MGDRWRVIKSIWGSLTPVQRRLYRGSVACGVCGALSPWVPTGPRVLLALVVVAFLVQALIICGVVLKEADSQPPVGSADEEGGESGRFG